MSRKIGFLNKHTKSYKMSICYYYSNYNFSLSLCDFLGLYLGVYYINIIYNKRGFCKTNLYYIYNIYNIENINPENCEEREKYYKYIYIKNFQKLLIFIYFLFLLLSLFSHFLLTLSPLERFSQQQKNYLLLALIFIHFLYIIKMR